MKCAVFVGNTKGSVQAVQKAVMKVVNSSASDSVKKEALKALQNSLPPKTTSLNHCTFLGLDKE